MGRMWSAGHGRALLGVTDATRTGGTRQGARPLRMRHPAGQPAGCAREASRISASWAALTRGTSGFITRRS
ncbi:hypothetical protein GCM10009601_62410 [Streptomyces thermospinosisporus]|uniref:Uncharacterized protein n=1 Tax=Streptomyces thermospinosisporus TaxID=161482 RepID=A0ABN1Z8R2_9ACTN